MSDNTGAFGFGKYVPGFDFLQNLAKGASQSMPNMPHLSNWVAPTLNVEELDKRIHELKAVLFWLEQNGKALSATIQALEVQKMTLNTLQGMNFNLGEMAEALKVNAEDAMAGMQKIAEAAAPTASGKSTAARPRPAASGNGRAEGAGGGAPIDPLQWWGALTQQFQEIASNAMKDVAEKAAAAEAARPAPAAGADKGKAKEAAAAPARAAAKKPARKAATKPTTG